MTVSSGSTKTNDGNQVNMTFNNITVSGSLTLPAQTANSYYTGPQSGSAAVPTFKTLRTPTVQTFTTGTGATYTPATGALYIRVKMVGGGGGGSGSGTGGTATTGSTVATATTFFNASAGGGQNGQGAGGGVNRGVGGSSSLGAGAIGSVFTGSPGEDGRFNDITSAYIVPGVSGGSSVFGGCGVGVYNATGGSAVANSGSGGAGGGSQAVANVLCAPSGGAGGFVDMVLPATTYTYSVGIAGTGGTAGTSGYAGGAGARGYIEVTEFYQ